MKLLTLRLAALGLVTLVVANVAQANACSMMKNTTNADKSMMTMAMEKPMASPMMDKKGCAKMAPATMKKCGTKMPVTAAPVAVMPTKVAPMATTTTTTTVAPAVTVAEQPAVMPVAAEVVIKEGSLIDVAQKQGSFKTLTAALKAAGLEETLEGAGPYTLFAPTDAAFAALPAGTVEDLLKPENKEKLVKILTYHVLSGKVMSADASKLKEANTVEGEAVKISTGRGMYLRKTLMINNASVTKANIEANNGTLHIINKVLMPAG
jgi:uncharacterized surface protein with fasciclin (FAS1) repeats